MSSISGVNGNFGFEAMAAAMTKRSVEQQGEIAMDLLSSTAQSVQQVNAQAAAARGNIGNNINVRV